MTLYLSVSQRTAFKRCPWQWQWRYIKRLEPKISAPALRFGKLGHLALEKYYAKGTKRGPHPAKTFVQEYERELETQMAMGFRDDDGTWANAGTLGETLLNRYVDTYGGDEEYRVLGSEVRFEVPINGFTAIGVIDGIWQSRVTKEILFVDHKFVAQIQTGHLIMDDQAGQYATFGVNWAIREGIIPPDAAPTKILFNFVRKQTPPENTNERGEVLNKDGSVSKRQPAPIFVRHATYRGDVAQTQTRARIKREAELISLAQEGELPIVKSPSPMNCATCSVREICQLHEIGQDYKAMARATMTRRKLSPQEEAIEYEKSH